MSTQPFSVIEVGTSKTVFLIGRAGKNGAIEVVSASTSSRMTGIRKGGVFNAGHACRGILTAVNERKDAVEVPYQRNWVILSGGNVSSNTVVHSVLTNTGIVTPATIRGAIGGATKTNLENRTILHQIPQNYTVTSGPMTRTVQDPKTLPADSLQANVLLVHCDTAIVKDLHSLVEQAHISVRGFIFSAACADRAVLSDDQRRGGVLLLNIGAGTTSFVQYNDRTLCRAGSIPVGGDHVTNDLALAFHLNNLTAESVKVDHSSAVIGDARPQDTAFVPASGFFDKDRVLSLREVNTVVNARYDELFRIVLEVVGQGGYSNVVLVGGCALQKGITTVAESVFRRPCSVGSILDGTHFGEARLDPLFATAYGALSIALEELTEVEHGKKEQAPLLGFFKGLGKIG